MRRIFVRSLGALGAMLALAGCGGVIVEPLPVVYNVLPATAPAGSTAGIEDYLHPWSGVWIVGLDGQVQTIDYGTAILTDALVYDADFDEWIVNVDGRDLVLTDNGAGGYDNWAYCTAACAEFHAYDNNPYASQYGTFAYVSYEDASKFAEFYVHTGLKTAPAAMPTRGTATYAGVFDGVVNYTVAGAGADYDYISGGASIDAAFSPGGGTVTFSSAGTGDYAGSSYSLAGAGIISGNSYQGSVNGWYDDGSSANDPSLVLDASGAGSSLSGAFYGPGAEETAGVVYGTSAAGDPYWGEIAGGFWASE